MIFRAYSGVIAGSVSSSPSDAEFRSTTAICRPMTGPGGLGEIGVGAGTDRNGGVTVPAGVSAGLDRVTKR